MIRLNEIIREIDSAAETEQWHKCILLCKKALPLTNIEDDSKWFRVRFMLSKYLLMDSEENPGYIEESISVLNEILANLPKDRHPIRWAMVNLGLGFAHSEKSEGRKHNIENTINYYQNALSVFTIENHPEEWAATMAGMGYTYAMRETGGVKKNLIKAIKFILNSLNFYTKADNPCQYWDKLKELKRLKTLLDDDVLWKDACTESISLEKLERDLEQVSGK